MWLPWSSSVTMLSKLLPNSIFLYLICKIFLQACCRSSSKSILCTLKFNVLCTWRNPLGTLCTRLVESSKLYLFLSNLHALAPSAPPLTIVSICSCESYTLWKVLCSQATSLGELWTAVFWEDLPSAYPCDKISNSQNGPLISGTSSYNFTFFK